MNPSVSTGMGAPSASRGRASRAGAAMATAAALVVAANALWYSAARANPFLGADWWYYVESFLIARDREGLTMVSLLAKRFSLDHALPLQKLLLLADAKAFALDLSVLAVAGIAVAVATLLAFHAWLRRSASVPPAHDAWRGLALLVLACAYLSMNMLTPFTVPLMSLYFITLALAWFVFASVAHAMDGKRAWLAWWSMLACAICDDDVAMLVLFAGGWQVAFSWLRHGLERRRAATLLGMLVVGYAIGRCLYLMFGTIDDSYAVLLPAGEGVAERLRILFGQGIAPWARAVVAVASNGVLHPSHLREIIGLAGAVQAAIALAVLLLHAWFWREQWCMPQTFLSRVAFAMMVFVYLLVAGILYGRVPDFGFKTLDSPRYAFFYVLAFLPLALQGYAAIRHAPQRPRAKAAKAMLLCCALLVVAPQPWFMAKAWQRGELQSRYYRRVAIEIGNLGQLGSAVDLRKCMPPLLAFCRRSLAERTEVLRYLQEHQYNAFSPRLRARYGLPPEWRPGPSAATRAIPPMAHAR